MAIIKLKDWDERPNKEDDVNAVIGQIYGRTADIKDAQIFAVAPPMISGYGTSTGFSMHLQLSLIHICCTAAVRATSSCRASTRIASPFRRPRRSNSRTKYMYIKWWTARPLRR